MDKELKDFLDSKFNKIDKDFEMIREDLNVNKNNILANRTNILVGFSEAKQERSVIEKRINDTYNAVDGFVKNIDDLQDEFTITKEDSKRIKIVLREKLGVDMA